MLLISILFFQNFRRILVYFVSQSIPTSDCLFIQKRSLNCTKAKNAMKCLLTYLPSPIQLTGMYLLSLYKINTFPHGSLCIMHNVYKKFNVARLYLTVSIVALNTNLKFEICSTSIYIHFKISLNVSQIYVYQRSSSTLNTHYTSFVLSRQIVPQQSVQNTIEYVIDVAVFHKCHSYIVTHEPDQVSSEFLLDCN